MSDYLPTIAPLALDSSSFVAPDVNGANITHGSDAASTAPAPPATMPISGFAKFFDAIDTSIFGNIAPGIGRAGVPAEQQKQLTQEASRTVLWSVLLVVIGLMLLSRGFGIIGEEGEGVIVNLSNPSKFPGIGHAIQGMKGKK